jgi:hypothetical protein
MFQLRTNPETKLLRQVVGPQQSLGFNLDWLVDYSVARQRVFTAEFLCYTTLRVSISYSVDGRMTDV